MPAAAPSRFVVGLDLGTTNSAVAYVDTEESPWQIRNFPLPQVVAPGQIEARDTLPSFLYQPAPKEFPPGSLKLPWQPTDPADIVGQFARDHGTLVPDRLIASAKSWLCHPGVDRTADLLPWHGPADVKRRSPVAVSARYIQQVREAWDAHFPEHPLAQQDFILTLPASFDEVARELTVRAAQLAGLKKVVLIEEPQAAFYAWIAKHADNWDERVSAGQTILVCDVGGGTSDFTLIRVRKQADGTIQFHRVAVGEHLILGGDNMDLALAHRLEQRLKPNGRLEPRPWTLLLRACRYAKEVLMEESPPEQFTITLPGSGSKLIGGSTQVPVTAHEVRELLIDGFFPHVDLNAKPQTAQSGFQEFGLPYAADAAITKHLAAFLTSHGDIPDTHLVSRAASPVNRDAEASERSAANYETARPDILLFNGGVFGSPKLRERLIDVLNAWFRNSSPDWSLTILDHERLDLAVARGAAYYGMVRRGQGVRIAAGLARSYYVGLAGDPPSAVCLAPAGIEPNEQIDLSQRKFEVLISQPIEFPLFYSSVRLTDKPGDVIPVDRQQLTPLPPIRTVLKSSKSNDADRLTVQLFVRLNEIGTLDLWCKEVASKRAWKLMFDVRSATQTEIAAQASTAAAQGVVSDEQRQAAQAIIATTFQAEGDDPATLMKRLTTTLDPDRDTWPPSLLRELWETLLTHESGRKLSPSHEARWLNLLGFCLRPGYGFALDDWRVAETWRALQNKLAHNAPQCRAEWWILWRRVAGGLMAGQQQTLIDPLVAQFRQLDKLTGVKGSGLSPHEAAEICRAAGAFELLPVSLKIELGASAISLLKRGKAPGLRSALLWMVGRLGARRPVYGPVNYTIDADHARRWLKDVMHLSGHEAIDSFTVMQLSRKTDDRYRDVDDATREQVLKWMDRVQSPKNLRRLVREVGTLDSEEQSLVFGESLPAGLRIL